MPVNLTQYVERPSSIIFPSLSSMPLMLDPFGSELGIVLAGLLVEPDVMDIGEESIFPSKQTTLINVS